MGLMLVEGLKKTLWDVKTPFANPLVKFWESPVSPGKLIAWNCLKWLLFNDMWGL